MAAPGVRELVYKGQLFEMTTVFAGRRASLQMEHLGVGWEHAGVARYVAQYAAGLDLLATVANEFAAA